MQNNQFIARFSPAEYQRRHQLTHHWMAANDLDALLIYSNAYGGDNIRWLAGFAPRHDTYLIWPLAGDPLLLTQLFNHLPNARRISVLADVRWGGPDSGAAVSEALQARGLTRGRVGMIGRLPHNHYLTFAPALPHIAWANAAPGYCALRLVKSREELDWLRQGAAYTDAAMAALAKAARPRVSEHELAAAIEAAYIGAGGEHGIHFLSTTPMDAPQTYVPAQTQTARQLQPGDVIISELSAGVGGYAGQIHRPLAVGRKPTPHYQHIYEVALAAYRRIVAALRPGATVGQVLDAAGYIEAQGLTVCDDLLHGYGMGYLPPVLRTRATAHSRQPPDDFTFEENMAIVVQPNVYDPASGAGLQIGNLLVITANDAQPLQTWPMDFQVCGL